MDKNKLAKIKEENSLTKEEQDKIFKTHLDWMTDGNDDEIPTGFGSGRESIPSAFAKVSLGEKMLGTFKSLNTKKNKWIFKQASLSKQKKIVQGIIKDIKQGNVDKKVYSEAGMYSKIFDLVQAQRELHTKLLIYKTIAKTTVKLTIEDFYAEGEKEREALYKRMTMIGTKDIKAPSRKNEDLSDFLKKRAKADKKEQEQGLVYLPYQLEEYDPNNPEHAQRSAEYDEFMEQYNSERQYCPGCGSNAYSTTLVDYILDLDKKEKYQNLNICTCSQCGNVHTFHDRVAIKPPINE